jgi:PAS domain S-box-containing protein
MSAAGGSGAPARRRADRRRAMPLTRRRASWIALVYALFAVLWIYGSDRLLGWLVADPEQLIRLSMFKGVGFVLMTAGLLWLLMYGAFGEVERGYDQLRSRESEIARYNQLYAALSAVSHAVLRGQEETALCETVCRLLVASGGFRVAWIGRHEAASDRLQPIAGFGSGHEQIARLVVSTRADRPEGRGPSGTAFREARPVVSNQLIDDPRLQPWAGLAREHGVRACAALPLFSGGRPMGVLVVYAEVPGFFREQEMNLLSEAAADVSMGLERLRLQAAREEAERRALEERRFSDAMIESLPGLLYLYDERGQLLRWNRKFEELTGYTADAIRGLQLFDCFAPESRPALRAGIDEIIRNGEASLEADLLHRDGRRRPYFLTGRPVQLDQRRCLVGIGIDISRRKAAEQALRELNATLEQKVEARTEELARAVERAEAADRVKSAFLATMSHELRTPLNSVIGFTGILQQGLAGPVNEEQARQLGMVRNSARHLLELVNDVLDLSKIEAGQLVLRNEPFDLAASARQTLAALRPAADKKQIELVLRIPEGPLPRCGDQRRVEQILLNLISNAIKFTESGTVTLRVAAEAQDGAVVLEVTDTGIGIRPQDQALLFKPFHQLDQGLRRQYEGSGLGLAICRRLTDLMGGRIEVESRWGEGSRFRVRIPLPTAAGAGT